MKTNAFKQTAINLRCGWYRHRLAACAEAAAHLPPRLAAHLDQCPGCRQFYQFQNDLGRELSAGAPVFRPEPPPVLRSRIRTGLRAASRTAAPAVPRWALAGVALIAVAAWLATRSFWQPRLEAPEPEAAVPSPPASRETVLRPIPDLNANALALWTGDFERSLEEEIERLAADGRQAVSFLANSFLPQSIPDRY